MNRRAPSANLVLFGFMASGKSTLGKLLSSRLGMGFIDADEWIENQARKEVWRIFAEEGEARFRDLERQAVSHAASLTGTVISTGGGVPLHEGNLATLTASGVPFFLDVTPEVIFSRLSGDESRPLASHLENPDDVKKLLDLRRPFYQTIPNRIDASTRTPAELADEIVNRFRALAGECT